MHVSSGLGVQRGASEDHSTNQFGNQLGRLQDCLGAGGVAQQDDVAALGRLEPVGQGQGDGDASRRAALRMSGAPPRKVDDAGASPL
jgi:hypothetical protein